MLPYQPAPFPLARPRRLRASPWVRRMVAETEKARAMVEEYGLDPDVHGPTVPEPPPKKPAMDELPDIIAKIQADAKKQQEEIEARYDKAMADISREVDEAGIEGFTSETVKEEINAEQVGPPKWTAKSLHADLERIAVECRSEGIIADEVEDKTITYLFTRPIPRGAVLAGKFLAYLVCTVMVVLPSVMIVYFLIATRGGTIAGTFPDLLKDLGLLAIALLAYGGVFAWVGAQFKRPLAIGLVFVFGFEQVALVVPGYLRQFTVAYYLQSLVPHAMPAEGLIGLLQSLYASAPSAAASILRLLAITAGFLFLAIRVVGRREYVLEQ